MRSFGSRRKIAHEFQKNYGEVTGRDAPQSSLDDPSMVNLMAITNVVEAPSPSSPTFSRAAGEHTSPFFALTFMVRSLSIDPMLTREGLAEVMMAPMKGSMHDQNDAITLGLQPTKIEDNGMSMTVEKNTIAEDIMFDNNNSRAVDGHALKVGMMASMIGLVMLIDVEDLSAFETIGELHATPEIILSSTKEEAAAPRPLVEVQGYAEDVEGESILTPYTTLAPPVEQPPIEVAPGPQEDVVATIQG